MSPPFNSPLHALMWLRRAGLVESTDVMEGRKVVRLRNRADLSLPVACRASDAVGFLEGSRAYGLAPFHLGSASFTRKGGVARWGRVANPCHEVPLPPVRGFVDIDAEIETLERNGWQGSTFSA